LKYSSTDISCGAGAITRPPLFPIADDVAIVETERQEGKANAAQEVCSARATAPAGYRAAVDGGLDARRFVARNFSIAANDRCH
jgi:hypothetical protein